VGYRSGKIGEKLKKMGFTNVYNLYGGIFEWKNRGYEVHNNQNSVTDSVHAYNRAWSVFLRKGVKVYE
jgi:3-mercaptopyruvate sulfurtransferase SseA